MQFLAQVPGFLFFLGVFGKQQGHHCLEGNESVESFKAQLRAELLNRELFLILEKADWGLAVGG